MLFAQISTEDDEQDTVVVYPNRSENRGGELVLRRFNNSSLVYGLRAVGDLVDKIPYDEENRVILDCIGFNKLVSIWQFNDNAKDSGVTEGNHLTLVGSPTYVTGTIDKSLKLLAASSQYAKTFDAIRLPGEFTFCFVFSKYTDAITSFFGSESGATDAKLCFLANNDLFFRATLGGASASANIGYTGGHNNAYQKLVVKRDSSNVVKASLNGAAFVTIGTVAGVFYIRSLGKNADGQYFDGELDQVRIYSRAISDDELESFNESKIHHEIVFTGKNNEQEEVGTYNETVAMFCRDYFKDTCLSEDINKKYADQEVSTTLIDVINTVNAKRNSGFLTTGIETLGISQPYNFVKENLEHLVARIQKSTLSEIFMRPHNKEIVMRPLDVIDSQVTFTDANIKNPETIKCKQGITDSFEVIRTVGGLSTDAADTGKRIISEYIVPNAKRSIQRRVYDIVDERFTTFIGAKMHCITIANDYGKEMFTFDQALEIIDATDLPMPGELVHITSNKKQLDRKFVVEEIRIRLPVGEEAIRSVFFALGKTEQGEIDTITLLQNLFESEKRKALDADAVTNQESFSVSIENAYTVTVTLTPRDKSTDPYKWADGRTKWGFATYGNA